MSKEIWTIHFNDIHIGKGDNEQDVIEGIKNIIKYCNKLNVRKVICGGDVFESRSFQRLSWLKCWEICLDLFHANDIVCYNNVGNHSKSLYSSKDSFVDAFRHHPALVLINDIKTIDFNGKSTTFSPFFSDDILIPQLEENKGSEVLIGHWEMQGSCNLGMVSEKKGITKKLLSKWDKVFLSHYHNYHKVSKNISHLPSLLQADFGEDSNKGFTIIYDDLSYEIVKGVFKEHTKIEIDLSKDSITDIKELIKVHKNSSNKVRFEISGKKSELDAFDLSVFENTGIDGKKKFEKVFEKTIQEADEEIITLEKYVKEDIEKEFEVFCKDKSLDYTYGSALLENFFKNR